jgi:MscS family membrane protein
MIPAFIAETTTSPTSDVQRVFTDRMFLGNSLVEWGGLVVALLAGIAVGRIACFLLNRQSGRLASRPHYKTFSLALGSLSAPAKLLSIGIAMYACEAFFNFHFGSQEQGTWDISGFWHATAMTAVIVAVGWCLYRAVEIVQHLMLVKTEKTESRMWNHLVPFVRKFLRGLILLGTFLFLADNVFGWKINTLIAGLGIGGLAVALAAQSVLASLLGSLTIFADHPFTFGDRIVVKGFDGIVEDVGFRSTRLRTSDGHVVTIPNSVTANEAVENIGRRKGIRRVLNLTLPFDTPPEKMTRAVEILQDMLDKRRGNLAQDPAPRVLFTEYTDKGLRLMTQYWFSPPEQGEFLRFNHEFNLELLRRFHGDQIRLA